MKKNLGKIIVLATIIFASCTQEPFTGETISVNPEQKEPLTTQQIDATIKQSLDTKGTFVWGDTSDYFIWSAINQGNNIATIGFGDYKNDYERATSPNNQVIEQEILDIISKYEGKSIKDILIRSEAVLNVIDVKIEKQETVIALRKNKYLRYIEATDYIYEKDLTNTQRSASSGSASGCGFEGEPLNTADYTILSGTNAKISWTFSKHSIPAAWNYSTGRGITVGLIDTGVSPLQPLLGTSFNNGLSTGRTITKAGTFDGTTADSCGHGTSMGSTIAGPRNNIGLPSGVAYNANLISVRASDGVVLAGNTKQAAVRQAFINLGNTPSVKIISMSMGIPYQDSAISEGVKYAYSKGKLIFCAAGTSTSYTTFVGVIFPASMAEVVAVTGINDGAYYEACDVCHTGSKVEFTVIMQRKSDANRTSTTNGYYANGLDYVGGSSVATATTAGIAALVWAKHPTWTASQVLTKLRQSAHLYNNRNSKYGYGVINAYTAVQ